MAANSYGSSNLPVTLKTTVVTTKDSTVTTVEKVHASGSVPAASSSTGVTTTNEPFGGGLVKQTVVTESTPYTGLTVPATTYESQGSMVELPIQQHPSFSSWTADWDETAGAFKPSSSKYGVTSYIVGSVTVTKTEYFTSQPTDKYADIGTREVPGGGYSGANQWLIIGTGRRKISDSLYSRETQYLYSAKAYDTDIY